jgi:hypothetical protein
MSAAKRQSWPHSREGGALARGILFVLPFVGALLFAGAGQAQEPTLQPSDVLITDPTPPPDDVAELQISWIPQSGDGTIVVMKQGAPVDSDPVDGTSHTASSLFGSGEELGTGNFVVFLGSETQVTVTNLQPDVPYFVSLYAKNGSGGGTDYLQANPANRTSGHNASHSLDCADCHFDPVSGAFHGGFSVPRDAPQATVCKTCHNPSGLASAKAAVDLHSGPNYTTVVDCGSCHEVHNNANFLISTDAHTGGATAANRQWIRVNTTKYVAAAQEPALYQGRCTDNGSLSCNSDQDCQDAGAGTCDSTGFFAFDAGSSPWNGICQNCHTQTGSALPTPEHRHTNDSVSGPEPLNHVHEVGGPCTSCHAHEGVADVDDDGFTPQGGDCVGCHSSEKGSIPRRQITESSPGLGDGEFGGGFRSHHVNDGSLSQIVTKWDCVVCHAEGDVLTGSPDDTYHQKDGVQLKNVDTGTVLADWPTLTAAQRSLFCMSCHDNGGSELVGSRPVTPPDPEDPDIADYTNDPLNPFNDGVTNAHESDGFALMCEDLRTFCARARDCNGIGTGTCNALTAPHPRGRCSVSDAIACGTGYECPGDETCQFLKVVDVETQFALTNASHHAVLGAAYGSAAPFGSNVDNAIQGARTDLAWDSVINCEDCHYGTATNMLQAHGTANARYMLRDKAGNDTLQAPSGTGNQNVNCFRCHIPTGDPGTYPGTESAYSEHTKAAHIDDTLNLFGISCLNRQRERQLQPQRLHLGRRPRLHQQLDQRAGPGGVVLGAGRLHPAERLHPARLPELHPHAGAHLPRAVIAHRMPR